MKKIMVAGGGTMGKGIALCAAQHGFAVVVRLRNHAATDAIRRDLARTLDNAVSKGKMDAAEATAALERIDVCTAFPDPDGVHAVIEAIAENLEAKQEYFAALSRHFPPGVLLASTTSSLSVTAIAARAEHPERCMGMHFFNPVPVMRLVEVIRGAHSDDASHDAAMALARDLGKTPVAVNDSVGFVVSRILVPMINDAAFLLGESVADAEAIDTAMVLGANHPVGPLSLGDRIGLDVCLNVLEILFEESRDSRYRPAPVLKRLVRAGMLGRKTGRGFFTY